MKYRDNMTAAETAQLLAECNAQDEAFRASAEVDALNSALWPVDAEFEDEYSALRKAALNHRGAP